MSLWSHGHFAYHICWVKKKREGACKERSGNKWRDRGNFSFSALYMWFSWRSMSMHSLSAPKGECFWAGIWGMTPEVLCFDPCAATPPNPTPNPTPTRFQGLGQRLVVLSPSAAETWYQELSSSFIVPSQVRLFTSFIYCSLTPPSLPSETTNTDILNSSHLCKVWSITANKYD